MRSTATPPSPEDLNDGSGRADKRDVILADRLRGGRRG